MNLRQLLALMELHQHNFHVMHWNAYGDKFDRIHSLCKDYYEDVFEDVDSVGEMAMRLNYQCVGYAEALKILQDFEGRDFKVLNGTDTYDYEKFCADTKLFLDDICFALTSVMKEDEIANNMENVGIKSALEGMYDKYDLQRRYLHTRRIKTTDTAEQ